jgi:hypothetical protein
LRHNVIPLRQAWRMDNDNDLTQAEQRDAPGGETAHEVKRSRTSVLADDANQLVVGGVLMAMGYGAHKVADKIRKPPDPPPPPPSGSASDSEA